MTYVAAFIHEYGATFFAAPTEQELHQEVAADVALKYAHERGPDQEAAIRQAHAEGRSLDAINEYFADNDKEAIHMGPAQ